VVNTSQQEKVKKVKLHVEAHTSYPLGDTGIMERAFIEARERIIKILETYDGRKFLNFDDAVKGAKRARVGIIRIFQEYAKKIEEDWYHNPTAVITTYEGYPNDEEYDVGAVLAAVSNGIEIYMFTAGFTINLKDYSLDPWAEFSWITATKGRDGLEIVRLNKLKTSLKRLVKIIVEKLYLDWLQEFNVYVSLVEKQ
jgi:hypothetical protein